MDIIGRQIEKGNSSMRDARINSCYTLRRNKLCQKNFSERYSRYLQTTESSFMIKSEMFQSLPNEFIAKFQSGEKEVLIPQYTYFLSSSDEIIVAYSVWNLRKLVKNFTEENLEKYVQQQTFEAIIQCMLNAKNLSILYEATSIIGKITKTSSKYALQLSNNEPALLGLLGLFSNQTNYTIRGQLLLILGNLIEENGTEVLQYINSQFPLYEVLNEYLSEKLEEIPNNVKWIVIWNIGLLLDYTPEDKLSLLIPQILPSIQRICLLVRVCFNKEMFIDTLECVDLIVMKAFTEDVIKIFSRVKIYSSIAMQIKATKSAEVLYNLFDILNSIAYQASNSNGNIFQEICDSGVFSVIEGYLNDIIVRIESLPKQKYPLIELIKFLENCILEHKKSRNIIIRKKNILKNLIAIIQSTSDRQIISDVLSLILTAQEKESFDKSKIYIELIRLSVPELLKDIIQKNYANRQYKDVIVQCLEGIYNFLEYGSELIKTVNILLKLYNEIGLKELLDVVMMESNDDEVQNKIKNIYMNYYS